MGKKIQLPMRPIEVVQRYLAEGYEIYGGVGDTIVLELRSPEDYADAELTSIEPSDTPQKRVAWFAEQLDSMWLPPHEDLAQGLEFVVRVAGTEIEMIVTPSPTEETLQQPADEA